MRCGPNARVHCNATQWKQWRVHIAHGRADQCMVYTLSLSLNEFDYNGQARVNRVTSFARVLSVWSVRSENQILKRAATSSNRNWNESFNYTTEIAFKVQRQMKISLYGRGSIQQMCNMFTEISSNTSYFTSSLHRRLLHQIHSIPWCVLDTRAPANSRRAEGLI